MATDQRGQARRPIEPLVDVVTDSVALGYQAVELVVEGLRESLRVRAAAPPGSSPPYGRPPRPYPRTRRTYAAPGAKPPRVYGTEPPPPSGTSHPGAGAAASSGALIGDLAGIASELLQRAGTVAAEVASAASARAGQAADTGAPPSVPELVASAAAGDCASIDFCVWNTGATALRTVKLSVTDLIGPDGTALAGQMTFDPPVIDQIGPGRNATVRIEVDVPKDAAAANYRGLVQAEPGDICAVLLVCVSAVAADPPPPPA
jgi:hypothetical protein